MAGIYIHIPFCRKACHYCNFHFSTSLKHTDEVLDALILEISVRADFLKEPIQSIYFGGGTPSVLTTVQVEKIIQTLESKFEIVEGCEITFEFNPDDVVANTIQDLKTLGINRISLGIQSFWDEDLKWMNRAHNAQQSFESLEILQNADIQNLNIDLIYGFSLLSEKKLEENLTIFIDRKIPHLSAYALTVEPNTALHHFVKKGTEIELADSEVEKHFNLILSTLQSEGYSHYEISNYALPGFTSFHNSNYWKRIPYLGIGPSAHSFDGEKRTINLANNIKYMKAINAGKVWYEEDILSPSDLYNEHVMTGLRTIWGVDINKLQTPYLEHFIQNISPFIQSGKVFKENNLYKVTDAGKLFADNIAMECFWVE